MVLAQPCLLTGVTIKPNGTNVELKLYDNATEESGEAVFHTKVDVTVSDDARRYPMSTYCHNGLYARVWGTNPDIYVSFS